MVFLASAEEPFERLRDRHRKVADKDGKKEVRVAGYRDGDISKSVAHSASFKEDDESDEASE